MLVIIRLKDPSWFPNRKPYPIKKRHVKTSSLSQISQIQLFETLPLPLQYFRFLCNKVLEKTWDSTRLCLINKALIPIHPLVADFFTILSQIPGDANWFSVLELKDTFFSNPQMLSFCLNEKNLISREKQQYTWIVLPQGYRDSPHLFCLGTRNLKLEQGTILKYGDDILACSPTQELSNHNTVQT